MKKMEKPEAQLIRFGGGTDVIATSGEPTLTVYGFGNGVALDGEVTFNGTTRTTWNDLTSAMKGYWKLDSEISSIELENNGYVTWTTFQNDQSSEDDKRPGPGNGTYTWYENDSGSNGYTIKFR